MVGFVGYYSLTLTGLSDAVRFRIFQETCQGSGNLSDSNELKYKLTWSENLMRLIMIG